MRLALMQPYFFPYIGYFSMIQSVDHFMFFDDVQFVKKSWMTRNRLLNLSNGQPFYIRPELQNVIYKSLLPMVELKDNQEWKNVLLSQTKGYKNKAPFYFETMSFLEELLATDYYTLVDLNMDTTKKIAAYIDVDPKIDKYTDYNFWFDEKPGIGDWGREVAIKVGATEYINAPGGASFIFPELFDKHNIKLGFIQPNLSPYNQGNFDFVPGLSIIDALMFNGRKKTAELVRNYKIDWKC